MRGVPCPGGIPWLGPPLPGGMPWGAPCPLLATEPFCAKVA